MKSRPQTPSLPEVFLSPLAPALLSWWLPLCSSALTLFSWTFPSFSSVHPPMAQKLVTTGISSSLICSTGLQCCHLSAQCRLANTFQKHCLVKNHLMAAKNSLLPLLKETCLEDQRSQSTCFVLSVHQ